ncbi:gamma-glutamyl-gamma-aminobutyrate hydrolase family protein [Arthrobacter crystallopoietes]|uniref:gamma-glutamyl-gamma-aminobutyrate hydrolase family protein n=1 Tax=Crystallibacter crystallopoietes TaxID=37928 RepID=UPI00111101CF|nr:gamma-glutamyl-gamma-aminobutyrate hydrolase family protein [Arthrobacter crystallopoietes]
MRPPIIGICSAYEPARWSFWDMPAAIVASTYLDHIAQAGGIGIGLIPSDAATASPETLLDRIDGLLLLGGADVDPRNYGESPDPNLEATVPLRDAFELSLSRAAFARDLPILGICRGMQIMNVACGGTLHQHLADHGYAEHRKAPGHLDARTFHDVRVQSDSWAAQGIGSGTRSVNSHHHQGVAQVATGATVSATSAVDSLPEALEWRHQAFALGVQWHPEAMDLPATIAHFVSTCAEQLNVVSDSARAAPKTTAFSLK